MSDKYNIEYSRIIWEEDETAEEFVDKIMANEPEYYEDPQSEIYLLRLVIRNFLQRKEQ